jgi:hypothetical protein
MSDEGHGRSQNRMTSFPELVRGGALTGDTSASTTFALGPARAVSLIYASDHHGGRHQRDRSSYADGLWVISWGLLARARHGGWAL